MNSDSFNTQARATLAAQDDDQAVAAEAPSLAYRLVAQRLFVDVAAAGPAAGAAVVVAGPAAAELAGPAGPAVAVVVVVVAAAVYTAEGFD